MPTGSYGQHRFPRQGTVFVGPGPNKVVDVSPMAEIRPHRLQLPQQLTHDAHFSPLFSQTINVLEAVDARCGGTIGLATNAVWARQAKEERPFERVDACRETTKTRTCYSTPNRLLPVYAKNQIIVQENPTKFVQFIDYIFIFRCSKELSFSKNENAMLFPLLVVNSINRACDRMSHSFIEGVNKYT